MKKQYLVYTGNLYPHKNIPILIEACEKLKIDLKVICARSVFASRLPESKYVEYLGRLSDEDMKKVYKGATGFVFPSLIEGFGLPGLEAMAVGLPVVAANASCLPEVYGDAALYFDPLDVNDLISKIKAVLLDEKLRKDLIKKGFAQVKKYSWSKMAKQTWEIYQNVLL
jgi:glycosyltransferase involved in cell wall biosynthesis